jgi:hypothetical protein
MSSRGKLRLNFRFVPKEWLDVMSSQTLRAGGYTEPLRGEPEIGDQVPDGTILAGISPDTGTPMYTTPADAPLMMKWNEAMKYAKDLDVHGHKDWRVPTKAELNVLFNNRARIRRFNRTGSILGWYWSSSEGNNWAAWVQRFSDGCQDFDIKDYRSAVRCVRS